MPDVREHDNIVQPRAAENSAPRAPGLSPWKDQRLVSLAVLAACVLASAATSLSGSAGMVSLLMALASLGAMGWVAWLYLHQPRSATNSDFSDAAQVNAALDALASHLRAVSSGDLGQPAPALPGPLGRVGSMLDEALSALSSQVSQLQQTAQRVEDNAIDATTSANALLEQAQAQSSRQEKVSAVLDLVGQDMAWIDAQLRHVATRSASTIDLSSSSAQAVSGMADKIDDIRAAAVDAGTRVSRLSGFSREISSLIDALARAADQAGVVALQASLQSEKAGAAGQGFRIVSESMKDLAVEIETIARRGSSVTTAASSDIEASSHAVEQVVMGSDDVSRLMDVAGETAQQSMETGKGLGSALEDLAARAAAAQARIRQVEQSEQAPPPSTRQAIDNLALVASARELNQKMGSLRP